MKGTAFILLLIILQTRASFFDAMTSVENAFNKLLNDVVTDVKNTVHCTILAVEHVLAISGAINEPSDYSKECNTEIELNTDNSEDEFKSSQYIKAPDFATTDHISQHVSKTIANVNKTLDNILDNNSVHRGLESIKRVLKNETNRLTEVSVLLKQELEKISNKVRKELGNNFDTNKSPLESLWEEMKILHDVENRNKNKSEANEIAGVLNEAINVLHINNTNEIKTDEDKMRLIMRNLENDSNSDSDVVAKIDQELLQWNENDSKLSDIQIDYTTLEEKNEESYEDIASDIIEEGELTIEQIEKKFYHGW